MDLSEIFFSIQGESTYSGLPCIFIRTSGCNLKCSYCDTTYANNVGKRLKISEIINEVNTFKGCKLVEVTGGEPLLQSEIYELFEELHTNDYDILLETNGSINLEKVPNYVCKIVDVKTPSSNCGDSFLKSNLDFINPTKDNIKFVIGDLNDYVWSKDFLKNNKLSGQHILFSVVFSKIEPKVIVQKVLEDKLDVRFQLQLHKYIWNPTERGV
ncbi:MAG: radical SAM protein [Candidatus Cloacimonetes bacterium]|jgi:7-carboxy-7-deazaguanine synthase|nr:radical SAM protein [Candidatus Cloacimonadota bacterium]MDD4156052.1 radical SAM protein [Candidatus Cloacimonadota bacterium]